MGVYSYGSVVAFVIEPGDFAGWLYIHQKYISYSLCSTARSGYWIGKGKKKSTELL